MRVKGSGTGRGLHPPIVPGTASSGRLKEMGLRKTGFPTVDGAHVD